MSFPERLVIASRNPGKIREILSICADWPVAWLTHENLSWPDVPEPGTTYVDNALAKAWAVASATGEAALADDSGIEADALGGDPGPYSARFAGEGATDEENLKLLVEAVEEALEEFPSRGRTARYRAVAVVAWPGGGQEWAEGTCEGTLRSEPKGTGGFGYDPIFEPVGWDRTMAELAPEEKDRISHRGRALRALHDVLAAG